MIRPRFSLRTLSILLTLVCAYFGAWEATKTWGIPQVAKDWPDGYIDEFSASRGDEGYRHVSNVHSPFPLVIAQIENVGIMGRERYDAQLFAKDRTYYYFWAFGTRIKVPFESDS